MVRSTKLLSKILSGLVVFIVVDKDLRHQAMQNEIHVQVSNNSRNYGA